MSHPSTLRESARRRGIHEQRHHVAGVRAPRHQSHCPHQVLRRRGQWSTNRCPGPVDSTEACRRTRRTSSRMCLKLGKVIVVVFSSLRLLQHIYDLLELQVLSTRTYAVTALCRTLCKARQGRWRWQRRATGGRSRPLVPLACSSTTSRRSGRNTSSMSLQRRTAGFACAQYSLSRLSRHPPHIGAHPLASSCRSRGWSRSTSTMLSS